jgi:hypothetical protein
MVAAMVRKTATGSVIRQRSEMKRGSVEDAVGAVSMTLIIRRLSKRASYKKQYFVYVQQVEKWFLWLKDGYKRINKEPYGGQ